jgi:hypothetical protein
MGDKIAGKVEEVVGKVTHDPAKVQEGIVKQVSLSSRFGEEVADEIGVDGGKGCCSGEGLVRRRVGCVACNT